VPYRGLVRLGGVSAVLSALLGMLSLVLYLIVVGGDRLSEVATSATFFLPSGAQLFAMLLLAFGLVALYVRQAESFGALGLAGFFLALIGTTLAAGALWSQVFVVPRLAEAAPEVADRGTGSVLAGFLLSFLILGVGWVVFGVATLRTRVFPRWAVILLIVGAVLAILPFPSRALVLEVAAACLGFTLLTGREAAQRRSPRAS
jgi:hypothetical protein